jgi:hypothetical protein
VRLFFFRYPLTKMVGNNKTAITAAETKNRFLEVLGFIGASSQNDFCHEEIRPNEDELVAERLISKIYAAHISKFPGYLSIHGSGRGRLTIGVRTSRVRDRSLGQQSR